ncbi:MAG: DUF429 domain-containing protein [Pseudomonadota bacterium]
MHSVERPTLRLAGIDLAWRPDRNPSAIAIGVVMGKHLHVERVHGSVRSLEAIVQIVHREPSITGVAIDAPLIIHNQHGKRECESELTRVYGGRKAGCHSANLTLYPASATVQLSQALLTSGYQHLDRTNRWQIECYPHPAIIELFGLPERLAYKKGNVAQKRAGQIRLAELLQTLSSQDARLRVTYDASTARLFDPKVTVALRGQALKDNEDALDAIVCLIIAAHYAAATPCTTFGSMNGGYIVVPTPNVADQL